MILNKESQPNDLEMRIKSAISAYSHKELQTLTKRCPHLQEIARTILIARTMICDLALSPDLPENSYLCRTPLLKKIILEKTQAIVDAIANKDALAHISWANDSLCILAQEYASAFKSGLAELKTHIQCDLVAAIGMHFTEKEAKTFNMLHSYSDILENDKKGTPRLIKALQILRRCKKGFLRVSSSGEIESNIGKLGLTSDEIQTLRILCMKKVDTLGPICMLEDCLGTSPEAYRDGLILSAYKLLGMQRSRPIGHIDEQPGGTSDLSQEEWKIDMNPEKIISDEEIEIGSLIRKYSPFISDELQKDPRLATLLIKYKNLQNIAVASKFDPQPYGKEDTLSDDSLGLAIDLSVRRERKDSLVGAAMVGICTLGISTLYLLSSSLKAADRAAQAIMN
ncbi:uncharacterized protein NEMAJ01_0687 [Nematocida major]|uniref:uncharacterized protein n=1 Tax=Nematocida major TaxID=1912982 RepID=UPI0020082D20|nr:uncharacterized protein NEMAJ01_0687 [Nematocida major]KAH9385791.1 hypothetical protein NEMAJ01_0687 [Nematocida major]